LKERGLPAVSAALFDVLVQINHKGVDAPAAFCYNQPPLTNTTLLQKESFGFERKRLTAASRFVIKFDFAGQLFATE
jgi:hypothetical protein